MAEEKCLLCGGPFTSSEPTVVGQKGVKTLLRICSEREFHDFNDELKQKNREGVEMLVHGDCYKKFTDKRKINKLEKPRKKLRSSTYDFDWKRQCFLCGVATDLLHRKREPVSRVTTLEFKKTILVHAEKE